MLAALFHARCGNGFHSKQSVHHVALTGRIIDTIFVLSGGDTQDAFDGHHYTPLFNAIRANRHSVITSLLRCHCDVELTGTSVTPLHFACIWKNNAAIQWLLLYGANPNVRNGEGRTPIMEVVASWDLCVLLLEAGARIDAKDDAGESVLHHARRRGAPAVEERLQRRIELQQGNFHLPDAP